jgi:hypothetical protein
MLEVYVIISLAAAGYLFNSMGKTVKQKKKEINQFELPSMTNIYDSTYIKKTNETDRKIAEKVYKEALNPKKTNRIMSLTGEMVDENTFTHNNMDPYFGGNIRQNMDIDRNAVLLENFTGVSDIPKQKCEVKTFYDKTKNMGNVFGVSNNNDYYRDRIEQPKLRNNEVPIQQIRVGPGLNQGYTSKPVGGFQQFEDGEIARAGEKCVNELRVKTNPKETFKGRNVDGMKAKLPGTVGKVNKNLVERFYEQTPDMLLKTTGANLKPSSIPQYNVKETNRLDTTIEYQGTAKGNLKRKVEEGVKPTSRQQLEATGIRNAVLSALGLGQNDDYGKGNVIVYNNERDLTSTKTYQGNLTSLIKAIVAPIEDFVKVTKKQEYVDNPRHFGQISAQMPEKITEEMKDDLVFETAKMPKNTHYTIITLKDLNHKILGKASESVQNHLASMYRGFIDKDEIEIRYNGKLLKHKSFEILKAPSYKDLDDEILNPKKIVWKKKFEFDFPLGCEHKNHKVSGFAAICDPGDSKKAGFSPSN